MSKKKKSYTADFKSKLVLELFESGDTINAVASRHGVLPNTVDLSLFHHSPSIFLKSVIWLF